MGSAAEGNAFPSTSNTNEVGIRAKPHHKTELEIFQTLVGIRFLQEGGAHLPKSEQSIKPANPLLDIFLPSKTGANRFRNRGLFDRTLSQDMKNRVMYSISHYVISFLYLLQIVLAATFTALSASKRSSTAPLTILGALNTVLAGILAWLTGQGMPVRFRRARDQYREVVKAIEASERVFAEIDYIDWAPGQRPNALDEHRKLERMYEDARLDQEANYPETQNTPAANQTSRKNQELEAKVGKKKDLKEEMEKLQQELDMLRNAKKAER